MNKKKIVLLISSIAIIILGIGGKMYMDKQEEIQEERNQAVKEIQEQASKYIIENYSGIDKIEWYGWTIPLGPSNITTTMRINGLPKDDDGKSIVWKESFSTDEHNDFVTWLFSYDTSLDIDDIIQRTELILEVDREDEKHSPEFNYVAKEFQKYGVKKSKEGSPNAQIVYNWEEEE
ncbi:hypothetical protein [uncultured Enterococcus sp.]|uniref:hypothetical protein n=1 Tax=uncultured Enterococcus sp. TaxID=167972 RepID=UPI002AA6C8EC|nr:hypothetical protein [uncultured Enterococcus sp.]